MHLRFRLAPRRAQQGNTLVGIVIGLVIGLVIAVVVALVISKGSSPFTDKSGKVGKPAEPTAGQISDPNKPMYGNKDAAREAAREFAKEPGQPAEGVPPPAAPPAQAPKDELQQVVERIEAAAKNKPAAPAAAGAAPAAPATGAPVAPAATTAAAPAANGEDKYVYYLQAGAFREMADAENQRAKLALMGFEAAISDRTTDAGVLHRVRMGPFAQVEAMNKARSKLSENGVDVSVVRNQR